MSNDYKEHAKYLTASMGKDKAFEYAWGMKEYHLDMTSFWADVARCIDPVMYSQVCKEEEIERLKAENEALRVLLRDTTLHLGAAVDLLKRGGRKAVASDKMFDQMRADYTRAFERGRDALRRKGKR